MATDGPAARVQRMLFMRSLPAARDIGYLAEQLADVSRDVHFDEGTVIYEGGGPSDFLYFIVKGEVALESPTEVAWAFHERDGFGFLDAMSERPHARTARAVTDVHVLAMHAEDWLDVLEDNFALGRAMIMTTCDAVREKVLALAPDGAFPELAERNSTMSDPPNLVERLMVLRQEGVLERAGVQALATLAAHAKPVKYAAGKALFLNGQTGRHLHIVANGLIELSHEKPELKASFVRGQLVGGLAAQGEHKFFARALTDSVVLRIREEDWFDVMEDHFDVARSAFRYMATERERVMLAATTREAERASEPPVSVRP